MWFDHGPDKGTDGDRAAVVGFNDAAWLQVSLTDASDRLLGALQQLSGHMTEGTRFDLGLLAAEDALPTGAPAAPRPAIVVRLTDGLRNRMPTPESGGLPEDTVRSAAKALRETGALVYTVQLCRADDLDQALLRDMAGGSKRYWHAVDSAALEEVCESIAREVTCGR